MRLLFLIFAVWLVAAPAPRAAAQDVAPEDLVLTQVAFPLSSRRPTVGANQYPAYRRAMSKANPKVAASIMSAATAKRTYWFKLSRGR